MCWYYVLVGNMWLVYDLSIAMGLIHCQTYSLDCRVHNSRYLWLIFHDVVSIDACTMRLHNKPKLLGKLCQRFLQGEIRDKWLLLGF